MASELELRRLVQARNYGQIAIELIALEAGRAVFDFDDLRDDPEGALAGNTEVTVEYDTRSAHGCSVIGYYRNVPAGRSIIFVHPSLTNERDRFTILHELGHHVQRQHLAWANVRYSFATEIGAQLEESVANAFAAEVLIPATTIMAYGTRLTADTLADVHARLGASRAAVAMRAIEITPKGEDVTVVVADTRGTVTFAQSSGDGVFAPARGRVQPGIAMMIERALARGGSASGALESGLEARSGWAQQSLTIDIAIDHSGGYAFAVIRPAPSFGRKPDWSRIDDAECVSEACGTVFPVDQSAGMCPICSTPNCPACGRCACEPAARPTCDRCWLELSPAEQSNPSLHECL